MKIFPLHIFFLLCLVFTGCTITRTVENNTFQSSFPEFAVAVSPEIKYFGTSRSNTLREVSNASKAWEETDAYYFFMPDAQNGIMLTKGVVVGIVQIDPQVRYVSEHRVFGFHYILEHGVSPLSGENYDFVTSIWYPKMSKKFKTSLTNAAFEMPKCVLRRRYQTIEFGNMYKFIDYWEDVSKTGFDCNKWKDERSLEPGQQAYLNEFNRHASAAFKIVPVSK